MALPTTARPPTYELCIRRALLAAGTALASLLWLAAPASAQNLQWVGVPKGAPGTATASQSLVGGKRDPNAQMLVRADEVQYDYTNELVIAAGQVQIYYKGSTLEANKVIFNQKTKRVRAEGNVRLREADGKLVAAEILDLNDEFRDGFVDSLRLDAPDKTRFAAPRAERSDSNYTVFQSGVYTACEPCKNDPLRPPKWQVKASRIIHDETEKMIYFENARLEAFGIPLLWSPFFSTPDPTVKRKTGVLLPRYSYSSKYGIGLGVPYYWALAPDYDFTITPTYTTKQGLLVEGEWRQRLVNGSYSIRAAGIMQQDKDYFLRTYGPATPGYRDFRGFVDSTGIFSLNEKWVWGWDATVLTDKTFLQDYGVRTFSQLTDPFKSGGQESISQLYLAGRGDRSYFDLRGMYFYGFSELDQQDQLPVVHPVLDYKYTHALPMLGGELSHRMNVTSLSRENADFDPINQTAVTTSQCDTMTADPARKSRMDCVLRGAPGSYSRASAQTTWRRTLIDPYGQVFTPFASLRADVAAVSLKAEPGVSNFVGTSDEALFRAMPTVGVEYRYPFIGVQSWGTQILEPIAQLIVRPNESNIGKLPNEDAQSLVFDDSNLFRVDKFSGWDRTEGGGRLNAGVQYTAQFNGGGFVNAMFGQSYHLFGKNSYAVADTTNTGLDSGLESDRSDYVARISYQPDRVFMFTSRFRFDEDNFAVRRMELEGRATVDRWNLTILYGNYDAQPEIGFLDRREGILGTAAYKVTQNWSLLGGARYDLDAARFDQYRVGLGYIDDCFAISVNYIADYTYSGNPQIDHKVLLQISLRTLGTTQYQHNLGNSGNSQTSNSSVLGNL